jgi:hypothetical protein
MMARKKEVEKEEEMKEATDLFCSYPICVVAFLQKRCQKIGVK